MKSPLQPLPGTGFSHHMDFRRQIRELPSRLAEMIEKRRSEFDRTVRRVPWSDAPAVVVAGERELPAALAAARAIKTLLGSPARARLAGDFLSSGVSLVRARSLVLVVEGHREAEELQEVARRAKSQGGLVLAVTFDPGGRLARSADGVFAAPAGEEKIFSALDNVLLQAAVDLVVLVAALALKRRERKLEALNEEFADLPGRLEWVLVQLADASRSLANEIAAAARLVVVGAGFYHAAALECAALGREVAGLKASAFGAFEAGGAGSAGPGDAVLFFSGTWAGDGKRIERVAARYGEAGGRVLSITDSGGRALLRQSSLAVLLPPLAEMTGALLALSLAAEVVGMVAEGRGRPARAPLG